jgi:hypothetical protein
MGLRQWPAALEHLQAADRALALADMVTGQAVAASLLALCDAALGRTRDRDLEAAKARELRGRITERQEVFQVDIALAQVRGLAGDRPSAIAALRELAADASRRRWLGWSLEAKLAAVQLAGGDHQIARQRAELTASARKAGYGWIVRRLS